MLNKEIKKGISILSKKDPILKKLCENKTITLEIEKNYFKSIAKSIIWQQVSWKSANTIYKKFLELFEEFPEPERILKIPDEKLKQAGLSFQKIKYLKDAAKKFANEELKIKEYNIMSNKDIINDLIKIEGVGKWTAEMFLIFSLGKLNVLPTSDLGIRKAIMKHYSLKTLPNKEKLKEFNKKWNPYNTIASLILWQSKD